MNIKIKLVVTRLNGTVTKAVPIQSETDIVPVEFRSEFVSDEDIINFYHDPLDNVCNFVKRQIDETREIGMFYDQREVHDIICKLSNYSISIEEHELEVI